ncbi:MAG TPA: alpha/beta hydrolase, partial [Xanthomonadaceae bacterium]|nr:alpha/beta hydrolase [Xanthomonadaceae bacterium]
AMSTRLLLQTFLIAASLLIAGCTMVGFAVANIAVDSRAIATVEFDPAHALSLDVHRPTGGPGQLPVVVFFYGGSWQNGTRQQYRFVGQSLARAGFLVIVPDYRKAPQVAFPAFIEDSARAVAWTRAHAAEYGGDPSRIFLMGHSSGAHMAAMLGTDSRFLSAVGMQPRDLAGIVGLSGPYDFLPITDPKLKPIFGAESQWPMSQPVNFVDGHEPPFLLLQGTADDIVWPRNAERLAAKLRAQNEPVEVDMIDVAGHAALLIGLVREASPVRQDVLQYLQQRTSASAGAPPRSAPPQQTR